MKKTLIYVGLAAVGLGLIYFWWTKKKAADNATAIADSNDALDNEYYKKLKSKLESTDLGKGYLPVLLDETAVIYNSNGSIHESYKVQGQNTKTGVLMHVYATRFAGWSAGDKMDEALNSEMYGIFNEFKQRKAEAGL